MKGLRVAEDAPTDQGATAPEAGGTSPIPKGRRSLLRLRRELTDDELNSSGVQKILMDDIDRLEAEKVELLPYVNKFHAVDKANAVLLEKGKVKIASDIAFGVFLTVGAASVGYSPNVQAIPHACVILVSVGIFLMLAGVVSKVILK